MLASIDGADGTSAGGHLEALTGSAIDSEPSTASFLRHAQLDPTASGYHVTDANIAQLHRSLWSSIFAAIPPAYFLPREVAPTNMHALVFLERCNWKLGDAQRRAAVEINERRREGLGSLAASSSGTLSSPGSRSSSPSLSASGKSRAFAPPRQATPPPEMESDEQLGPDYGPDRKGLPCGHIFKKGETIYRCRDCALDDTCVLCAPCFNSSNHDGHNVVFNVSDSGGGCCDCGDEEAWKSSVTCKYHLSEEDMSDRVEMNQNAASSSRLHLPKERDVGSEDASSTPKAKEPDQEARENEIHQQIDGLLKTFPIQSRTALAQQLSLMISFVLDTLESAPTKAKLEKGPDALQELKQQRTLQPSRSYELHDDTPSPVGAYSFDVTTHQRMYAVILWNDEKHSFREVIDIVSEATGKSEIDAKGVADRIDRHGREIIEISSEVRRLYLLANKLGQIDLAVTIRPAYDVYAEEIAGHVIEFLLGLVKASLYIHSANADRSVTSAHPLGDMVPNAAAMRAVIAKALLKPWLHKLPVSSSRMSQEFFDQRHLKQLDGLILMDHKMWKSSRRNLMALYMALIGPREIKRAIASRFAAMFPRIVETFLMNDREPEHSVRNIAVQLFSVPSIASELVESQNLLYKMLLMAQSVFTGQITGHKIILPPDPHIGQNTRSQSMLARQQRCEPILQDLRYLIGAEGVQDQFAQKRELLEQFANFLLLFSAILPERRAINEHVEFESEVWIPVVHITTHLAFLAKSVGRAFTRASSYALVKGLHLAIVATLKSEDTLHSIDPENHLKSEFAESEYGTEKRSIIKFDVLTQPVSFYHPLHWLVAEIFKAISDQELHGTAFQGTAFYDEVASSPVRVDQLLMIADYPLRVIVKLKQIRVGLWVRNGFGVRSQAHHYRDNNIREVTLDQDLFLVQCILALCPDDNMLLSMVERFSLSAWLKEPDTSPPGVDQQQIRNLAEELLLLLITLLSETSMTADCSIENQVKRELIHFLALGQGTYSDITRNISDRLKDHASFERILAEVSQYRAPDGSNDLGIFTLKPEFFDEVQPYFFHYTRNQREKAEQILEDRFRRHASPGEANKFVVLPRKQINLIGSNAIISQLSKTFLEPVYSSIILDCLANACAQTAAAIPDGLIDAALQLLMMGLVEEESKFASLLDDVVDPRRGSLFDLLYTMQSEQRLSSFKAKIDWILNEAARLDPSKLGLKLASKRGEGLSENAKGTIENEDKRKAAAKARQVAIMKQFSQQQQSLLDSLGDDDEEDSDDPTDAHMEEADSAGSKKGDQRTKEVYGSCIFCQEDLHTSDNFGCLAHIQGSRMVRNTPRHDANSLQQSLQTPLTLDRNAPGGQRLSTLRDASASRESSPRNWDGFPAEERRFGFYASSCGHLMHLNCFDTYCRTTELRHIQQIARNHPEDLSRSEFVCPLCKSLGNVVLPVAKALQSISTPALRQVDRTPLTDWIRKINIDILKTPTRQLRDDMQELEYGTGCFTHWFAEDAHSVIDRYRNDGMHIDESVERILDRFCNVLKPLSHRTRNNRNAHQSKTILSSPNRKMYIPEEVVAYTISVLEISQRGKSSERSQLPLRSETAPTVADSLSEQSLDHVVALIQCLRQVAYMEYNDFDTVLRHGMMMRLLPQWGGHDAVRSPLLLREPLTVLVEAAVIMPESLSQITVIMFYVQLVQVIFGIAQPSLWPQGGSTAHSRISSLRSAFRQGENDNLNPITEGETEALSATFDDVRATVSNIIGLVGYARGNITLGVDNLDDSSLAKMICTYCLPFLRRATILRKAVSSVMPNTQDPPIQTKSNVGSEFVRLMTILDIPMPRDALSVNATRQTALAGLVEGWIKHAYPQLASIFRPLPIQPSPLSSSAKAGGNQSHHQHQHGYHPTLQLEHPHIYELIRLPKTLTALLTQCHNMRCKRCGDPPPDPAICLECGELLCFQNFCCQGTVDGRGECNLHLDECGHSIGMFFKIKSNIIVLLSQGKGCFTYSPYLDLHGEIDVGLKKGKIQYLHTARFDELRKQWLQHSLANIIARKTESVMDQGGWTTM